MPEVDTAVRSLTVMWDGSLVVAANNHGTCYVWRLLRGNQVTILSNLCYQWSFINLLCFSLRNIIFFFLQTMTNFEPLHKLQAHNGYILKCLLSPEFCEPHRFYWLRLIFWFFCSFFGFLPDPINFVSEL